MILCIVAVSAVTVGDVLIAVGNLVLSQFSGYLEDFWESGLQTFSSGLGKKKMKNMFQKKITEIPFFLQEIKISNFHLYSE